MIDKKRIFATSRIGDPAENRYELEVFQGPEAPSKKLIIEKVKSGINGFSLYRVRVRRKVLVPFLPLYS